jgi:hypothetical protein
LTTGGCGTERQIPLAGRSAGVEPVVNRAPPTTPETAGWPRGAGGPPTAAATTGPLPTAPAPTPLPCGADDNRCAPGAVDCGDALGQVGPPGVGPIRITGSTCRPSRGPGAAGVARGSFAR